MTDPLAFALAVARLKPHPRTNAAKIAACASQ